MFKLKVLFVELFLENSRKMNSGKKKTMKTVKIKRPVSFRYVRLVVSRKTIIVRNIRGMELQNRIN